MASEKSAFRELLCPKPVAILLASCNGEKYIAEQLDSLVSQTSRDFICYIHDDGSEDGTVSILNTYREQHPDLFVILPGQKKGSARDNFAYLLRRISAEYIMFCDQDDIWNPDKVEVTLGEMKRRETRSGTRRPAAVYTDLTVVDEDLTVISGSFYPFTGLDPYKNRLRQILMDNVAAGCTIMLNAPLRPLVNALLAHPDIPLHDWAVSLAASSENGLFYLDTATMLYRQHTDNTVGATRELSLPGKARRAVLDIRAFAGRKTFYNERPRKMAAALAACLPETHRYEAFLWKFARIGSAPKAERIRFYRKHRLYRQRLDRAWQLLWI